jgi:hypothetical protein
MVELNQTLRKSATEDQLPQLILLFGVNDVVFGLDNLAATIKAICCHLVATMLFTGNRIY